MVGCATYPSHYILRNPRLALRMIFGPQLPYAYRLRGPHAWDGAKKAIEGVDERVWASTHTRKCTAVEDSEKKGSTSVLSSMSMLTAKVASVAGAAAAIWWAYPAVNAFFLQLFLHE
ncbi:Protein FMO-4 a [Aphelenchoides avenae]|nr:Protein FMO-4 a [Aphelenchus avenae]